MDPLPILADEADRLLAPLACARGLALAVSGGPDSTALMLVVAAWRARNPARPAATVLTVDHGLRPEAAAEAAGVVRQAKALGLAAEALVWHPPADLATGIPAAARAARYHLLAEAARRHGASHVVTAHSEDDQAETLIMRLARGSGLAGLGAMAPERDLDGLVLARPLLAVPKARLVATCRHAEMTFVEDPTNRDTRFTRPRVREVLTALGTIDGSAARLAASARRLARAEAALAAHAREVAAAILVRHPGGAAWMRREAFAAVHAEIRVRLIGLAVQAIGLGPAYPISLADVEAAEAAITAGRPTARSFAGAVIAAGPKQVVARREIRRGAALPVDLRPGGTAEFDGRFRITLAGNAPGPVRIALVGAAAARRIAEDCALAADMPRSALATFPAAWREAELVAVPHLGVFMPGFDRSLIAVEPLHPRVPDVSERAASVASAGPQG